MQVTATPIGQCYRLGNLLTNLSGKADEFARDAATTRFGKMFGSL
ncbi:MAG: hypothetical protein PF501_09390 [Salinisphaera sp.]|jgi:hypothetical protein|nr:hypothetical protein [Salinisphaera sp.]